MLGHLDKLEYARIPEEQEQQEEEEEESCILGVGYKLHNMMRVKPFCSSNIVECRKSILNNYHNLFFLRCIDSN